MNYKKISITIIALLLIASLAWYFFSTPLRYNIISINSFNESFNELMRCNPTTLITFDVDDTLITTHNPLLITLKYPLLFKIQAFLSHPKLLSKNYFELIASIAFSQTHFFPTEKTIISMIKQLQKNGCNIIGLTSIDTGSFGIVPSLEEWRTQMLHNFGIDFNPSFNENIIFNNLPQYRGNYPHFYKGIMYTNQQSKGVALRALLQQITFVPKAIISFDDNFEALESIAHACSVLNIPFTGYHYSGAKNIKPTWDTTKALQELNAVIQASEQQTRKNL